MSNHGCVVSLSLSVFSPFCRSEKRNAAKCAHKNYVTININVLCMKSTQKWTLRVSNICVDEIVECNKFKSISEKRKEPDIDCRRIYNVFFSCCVWAFRSVQIIGARKSKQSETRNIDSLLQQDAGCVFYQKCQRKNHFYVVVFLLSAFLHINCNTANGSSYQFGWRRPHRVSSQCNRNKMKKTNIKFYAFLFVA